MKTMTAKNGRKLLQKHRPYFDTALEAVELWGERHATDQQCSSHVGEAQHKLFGLSLYLNSQLPGGCQDESHRAPDAMCRILKEGNKQYRKQGCKSHIILIIMTIIISSSSSSHSSCNSSFYELYN